MRSNMENPVGRTDKTVIKSLVNVRKKKEIRNNGKIKDIMIGKKNYEK